MHFDWSQLISALIVPVAGGILKLLWDVRELKTNHFPHLEKRMKRVERKLGIEEGDL